MTDSTSTLPASPQPDPSKLENENELLETATPGDAPELDEADVEMIDMLVSDARVKRLWIHAERLTMQIKQTVGKIELADQMLNNVARARSYLLSGKAQFDEAEQLLGEVDFRLAFYERARLAGRSTGLWLVLYEVFWLILLAFSFYAVNLTPLMTSVYLVAPLDHVSVIQFLNSLIWGSLGGIVGALYALWKHIGEQQDFDRQYSIWYITNPILGVALGAFIFLIVQAGFLSLTAGGTNGDAIRSASVIYVLAWIAGFKQNVVYEMVRRVLDVFRVETKEDGEKGEPTAQG